MIGLLLRHLRLGVLQIGGVGIQLRLADRLRLHKPLGAIEGDLVQLGHGLQRFEPGDVVGSAQLE